MYAVESCRERLDTGEIKVINQPVAWNGERARPQPTFTFQFHGRPGAPVLRALRSARHRMPRAASELAVGGVRAFRVSVGFCPCLLIRTRESQSSFGAYCRFRTHDRPNTHDTDSNTDTQTVCQHTRVFGVRGHSVRRSLPPRE